MKKALFLLFLLPLISQAQIFADFGGGIESATYHPLVKMCAGYELNKISVEAVLQPSVTRSPIAPNYMGLKAGYNINNFVPGVGYYYNYKNSNDKRQNHAALVFSLKYIANINDNCDFYAEVNYIEKSIQLTTGVHIPF